MARWSSDAGPSSELESSPKLLQMQPLSQRHVGDDKCPVTEAGWRQPKSSPSEHSESGGSTCLAPSHLSVLFEQAAQELESSLKLLQLQPLSQRHVSDDKCPVTEAGWWQPRSSPSEHSASGGSTCLAPSHSIVLFEQAAQELEFSPKLLQMQPLSQRHVSVMASAP